MDVFYQKERCEIADVMFEVRDLQLKHDSPHISFSVHRGEILGLSGMVGSGRTEIVRAISGADPCHHMEVLVNGKPVHIRNPRDSIAAGIAHITEDRQRLGLNLGMSVMENTLLVSLQSKSTGKGVFYNLRAQAAGVDKIVKELRIKTPNLAQEVVYLSGGNQQKVVLGKVAARAAIGLYLRRADARHRRQRQG